MIIGVYVPENCFITKKEISEPNKKYKAILTYLKHKGWNPIGTGFGYTPHWFGSSYILCESSKPQNIYLDFDTFDHRENT